MNWLKLNLLVLVCSVVLRACATGAELDDFEDAAAAEEETAEAESPLVGHVNPFSSSARG